MNHFLFLNGSTRTPTQTGNTLTLARLAAQGLPATAGQIWFDLARLSVPAFEDLRHSVGSYPMPSGDAKALLDATLAATDIVLVSPVYWFSIPSPLKTYLDHWSGWLRVPDLDFKEKMRGKKLWVITTSGDRAKAQAMLDSYRMCAEFLGMEWQGALWGKGGAPDAILADAAACEAAPGFFKKSGA